MSAARRSERGPGPTGRAYLLGWAVLRALPEPLVRAGGRLAADWVWRRRGPGVRQLEANLRRVAPGADLRALSRAGMRSYARYWTEVFRLTVLPPERIVSRMRADGEEHLERARAAGRGIILALPHMGNWDQAGAYVVHRHGMPFATVAERLDPPVLYDRFVAFRESLGMTVLAADGPRVAAALAGRLRAGGLLCLVADRDLSGRGVPVDFFGEPARMPAGPAALALSTGAALLPTTLWFRPGGGWGARIGAPVEPAGGSREEQVAAMTQAMADAFAAGIAAHPADWHMLQPFWPADLAPSAAAAAA